MQKVLFKCVLQTGKEVTFTKTLGVTFLAQFAIKQQQILSYRGVEI